MTKRHFIALADAIRDVVPLHDDFRETREIDLIVAALMDFCSRQNPRFDRERWLDYLHGIAGPNGGKRGRS